MSGIDVDDAVIHTLENAADMNGRRLEVKELGGRLNLDTSTIYDILNRRVKARANEVARFTRESRSFVIADAIESRCGRVGVPLPQSADPSDEAMQRVTTLVREFGELLGEIGIASADGRYTRDEVAGLRQEGDQVIAAVHAFLKQIESQVTVVPARTAVRR